MGDQQQFCLRWNNHHINMLHVFGNLLSNEALVDVTLACEGSSIRAHKIVLSACSPFFQDVFLNNPCKHPVVVLKDMKFVELKTILEFMYKGEVNVSQDKLPSLLKSAENLKVKGLAEVTSEQQKNEKSDMHHSTVIEGVSSQCAGLVQSANNNETVSNSSRRKRKRKRSGSMLKEIYKQEMEDIIDIPDDEQISPLQHSGYDHPTISCDVNDVHQTSSVNDTHNTHSSSCNQASEDLDTQILEPHEIKEAPRSPPITAQNDDTQVDNPEYVLDPANFMEQSLSTCQEYLPSPTTKSRIKVDTSSPIVISTAGGDTSLNCTPNDSFTQGRSNSQCGHSDLSPGIGLQYDSTVSNNNSGLMVYMEPGTSGSCSASEASSSLSPSKGPPGTSDQLNVKKSKECPVCHKMVSSNLKRHMDQHQNTRTIYFCDLCLKPISRKDHLLRHKRDVHFNDKRMLFSVDSLLKIKSEENMKKSDSILECILSSALVDGVVKKHKVKET